MYDGLGGGGGWGSLLGRGKKGATSNLLPNDCRCGGSE